MTIHSLHVRAGEMEIEVNSAGLDVLAEDEEASAGYFQWLSSKCSGIKNCFSWRAHDEAEEDKAKVSEAHEEMSRLDRIRAIRDKLIRRLHFLGTPKAATVIAFSYGFSQGVSNFLWAFNWAEHAGASAQAHAIIQEVGGLSASAESFLFGALVPVILYMYNKRAEEAAARASSSPEP